MTEHTITPADAHRWVEAYIAAWRSNLPDEISGLFTDDAQYRTEPWAEPWIGANDITAGWLHHEDEPGTWEFTYEVAGIDAARVFVQGVTRYTEGKVYSNLWVVDLAGDGRARSFTEWYVKQPDPS
ncbi:nuclear transport factor 2 family protein [Microbacterium sp. P04]|uniref:nuclear transport factor 2 family protein n=1 Tax=Microbacterium sp. P04 TaxID=3366947 RepID=UPI0037450BEA